MKRTLLLILSLLLLIPVGLLIHVATYAQQRANGYAATVVATGSWNAHNYELICTVAFSTPQQPYGPLVVYRARGADLRATAPVITLAREQEPAPPLFFPSPNGQYLALLTPSHDYLNGASLRLLSTAGQVNTLLVPGGVAAADEVAWSADSTALYYHRSIQGVSYNTISSKKALSLSPQAPHSTHSTVQSAQYGDHAVGYNEIHRVDLSGHDVTLLRRMHDDSSLRLIGVDRSGGLILSLARPQQPVELLRVAPNAVDTGQDSGTFQPQVQAALAVVGILPPDILPGNILRIGSDGASVVAERVLSWSPLRYTLVQIAFSGNRVSSVAPLFATAQFGQRLTPLNRASDGRVLVMSQVTSVRQDLAAQGIANVPAQEALVLADAGTGATQRLALPPGGQIVQAFWAAYLAMAHIQAVPQGILSGLLTPAPTQRLQPKTGNTGQSNASVFQQDEWMLEGHAGRLADAPTPSKMCYGNCPQGKNGAPHVSAAILHGVAYVESDWHQFNSSDYRVNNEAVGSPVESWDGGWGEFQQTWGMPPQCVPNNNCRGDATKVQQDQSYNIGTGVASLISDWNGTAGVASASDPNDPLKANDWFFAVWAYNGSYGNNPNDVPSSDYGHWYPGAPFRSIYEEYVWYFAAHQLYRTDNYLPSLGSALLPPQSDFANTSDSFVACVTCTIPDWTASSYDRNWVGVGAPISTITGYFQAAFSQNGGENVVGLPRDNGGGAGVHQWGAGLVQDFGGGSYLPGTIMLVNGASVPYWVYGGVWTRYVTIDHGPTGCHGYPVSALTPYSDPSLGHDSYYRQGFQSGFITWDTTKSTIVVDSCNFMEPV